MTTVRFQIPGAPVPKARARKGKHGNFYTPRGTRAFEDAGKILAKIAMHGAPVIVEAVEVVATLFKAAPKKNQARYPICKPDIDNLTKSLLDILNKTVLKDDAQVCKLKIEKQYTYGASETVIEVRSL